MKVIVNSGRTVHLAVKSGGRGEDGVSVRPTVKAYGPTHLIDLAPADANHLIARGFVRKYEEPKPVEVAKAELEKEPKK